ncbi:MAG: hypothetical protein MRECE_34c019 [Mycoplasmataceae bacterium CE_OT135]|nr:MAG: hypothetical protein MRECE_34c019 [Mycoplasmataceae bacterium CE_OT135]
MAKAILDKSEPKIIKFALKLIINSKQNQIYKK